jgi:glycosyltransferase involved in cell wall biosynthesis
MKLSIIIPAYNEEKWLPATLRQIHAGREILLSAGVSSEIIVCDNNSTDATAQLAREGGAVVVAEPINQIGRARNTGASVATGEWLLFLDADSLPSRELLLDLAATLNQSNILGGGATLQQDGNFILFGIALRFWNTWSRLSKEAAGSFLFCRREAFAAIGGFDPKFYAGEEIDFCRRLRRWGKARQQHLVILHRHPLMTSSRKAALYSVGEFVGFITKTIFRRGKTLQSRDDCPIWYDGRR